MAYDKHSLLSVLMLLETLHYQHEYKGREQQVVDETLEQVAGCVREMIKNGEES